MRRLGLFVLLMVAACTSPASPDTSAGDSSITTTTGSITTSTEPEPSVPAPPVPDGPVAADVVATVDRLVESVAESLDLAAVSDLADHGDPRVSWLLADLMRFYQIGEPVETLLSAFQELTGARPEPGEIEFVWASNQLMVWDLPAWDGYPEAKSRIFLHVEEAWRPFFEEDHGIDWRLVTWGGVLADQRPLGDNGPCNCIPALDDPATTDAAGGNWYSDSNVVFGLVVGDEALALPRHQMEIHEMVNLTLGGRDLGIPYCTLCGSAQAYHTDNVAGVDRVVLRTSGLLSRSNKLMYDLTTRSAIDTFTGEALSGPLGASGATLEQVTVVASTWGDWKAAHPETRILAEDGGIGREYPEDPLAGRDALGPIFPVGDIDPRLPAQEPVVGVIAPDGTPIAFPVTATKEALEEGNVLFEGMTIKLIDGIRVFAPDGSDLVTHQAFWFAWSQFHPTTLVWSSQGR